MNKTELKKILKPLIKQCIKEVIFEDGTLSNIVSEVAKGLGTTSVISETTTKRKMNLESDADAMARRQQQQSNLEEHKKRMLDSIGKSAYNGVNLFAQGDQTSGIKVLLPNETLTATCILQLEEYE